MNSESEFVQPSTPSILLPSEPAPPGSTAGAQPTQPVSTGPPEISEPSTGTFDVTNFNDITEELVRAAAESNRLSQEEQDADGDLSAPTCSPVAPVAPLTQSGQPKTSSRSTRPSKTKIPLKDLFRYPTDPRAPAEGLNFYWKWGIKHLEDEMMVAELMTEGLEDGDIDEAGSS
jgi:hypothetical protein